MLHQVRIEVTVLVTLGLAVAALVVALQRGGAAQVTVLQDGVDQGDAAASRSVPDGAEEVRIVDFAYEPEPVRVSAGTTVAWTNLDSTMHTVTAADGKGGWDSGYLGRNETYLLEFNEPGVYKYICTLHPPASALRLGAPAGAKLVAGGGGRPMEGTIIVQ